MDLLDHGLETIPDWRALLTSCLASALAQLVIPNPRSPHLILSRGEGSAFRFLRSPSYRMLTKLDCG
jgi:hypothetical protein